MSLKESSDNKEKHTSKEESMERIGMLEGDGYLLDVWEVCLG